MSALERCARIGSPAAKAAPGGTARGDMSQCAQQPPRAAAKATGSSSGEADPRAAEVAPEDFRRLAEALTDGVAVVCSGRLVWANDRLAALSGRRSFTELVGTAFPDLFDDTGRGLPDASAPRSLECALHRSDGEVRTVICRLAWRDPDSDADVWVIEDATHVRMLEAELLQLSRKLHAGNREVVSLRESLRRERAERLRSSIEREDIDVWLRWQLEALTELNLW